MWFIFFEAVSGAFCALFDSSECFFLRCGPWNVVRGAIRWVLRRSPTAEQESRVFPPKLDRCGKAGRISLVGFFDPCVTGGGCFRLEKDATAATPTACTPSLHDTGCFENEDEAVCSKPPTASTS